MERVLKKIVQGSCIWPMGMACQPPFLVILSLLLTLSIIAQRGEVINPGHTAHHCTLCYNPFLKRFPFTFLRKVETTVFFCCLFSLSFSLNLLLQETHPWEWPHFLESWWKTNMKQNIEPRFGTRILVLQVSGNDTDSNKHLIPGNKVTFK